jgi:hypothetical protein
VRALDGADGRARGRRRPANNEGAGAGDGHLQPSPGAAQRSSTARAVGTNRKRAAS